MDPSGFSASSRPTADSEFSLDLVSVEEDNLVTRSECVCFVCEVQSFPVLLSAQSSVGFAEFLWVAGFAVPLRASLPKVLSLNCERICC